MQTLFFSHKKVSHQSFKKLLVCFPILIHNFFDGWLLLEYLKSHIHFSRDPRDIQNRVVCFNQGPKHRAMILDRSLFDELILQLNCLLFLIV